MMCSAFIAAERLSSPFSGVISCNKEKVASIEIVIGGFPLMCMNTQKQIVIKVDDSATEFIRHWLLPLAMESAHSKIAKAKEVPPTEHTAAKPGA